MSNHKNPANYVKSGNFAMQTNSSIQQPGSLANPLSTCIFNSIDSHFLHGSSQASYSPECPECQNYMADRCSGTYNESETWDKMCSLYVQENTSDRYANYAAVNKSSSSVRPSNSHPLTTGQQLLRNSLERRFIVYGDSMSINQFDPNIVNSPFYRAPTGYSRNWSVRHIDGNTIDQDPLMNTALANPDVCADVLAFIYNAYANNELGHSGNIQNTKLIKHLTSNSAFYKDMFSRIAQNMNYRLSMIPSNNNFSSTCSSGNCSTKSTMLPSYVKGVPNCAD